MGREIRKVVKGWQHPKNEKGDYISMNDENFEDVFNDWDSGRIKWINGESEDQKKYNYEATNRAYLEWSHPPDPECYRKEYWKDEDRVCFQMYQNVSEGTPVSPVFDTLIELENWLVETQGHSRTAAHNFCQSGYAPSMTMEVGSNGVRILKQNVDTCE